MTTFAQTYLDQLHATLETIGLTEVEQAIHWIAKARDGGKLGSLAQLNIHERVLLSEKGTCTGSPSSSSF